MMEESLHGCNFDPGNRRSGFHPSRSPDKKLSLKDLRGKPVILAFYPADWSPVCGDQMALYNEVLPEFQNYNAQMVGISVDGAWCHAAYAKAKNLHFPLLADFEPKGAVSRAYGAYLQEAGFSERALFVIDKDGVITWSYLVSSSREPWRGWHSPGIGRIGSLCMTKLSVPVSAKDHLQGDPDAPFTLVEYGDYQCPSCGQAYPIVKRVQKHFGKRLSFVFRNFPLTQMHPYAEPAAETAEFAGAHHKFWEMHDLLYENQDRLDDGLLLELSQQLNLDPDELAEALESKQFEPRVRADFSQRRTQRRERNPDVLHQWSKA